MVIIQLLVVTLLFFLSMTALGWGGPRVSISISICICLSTRLLGSGEPKIFSFISFIRTG